MGRRRLLQGLAGLAVLAFLATLIVPKIMQHQFRTGCSGTSFNLRAYADAVNEYAIDHAYTLPPSLQTLHDEDYLHGVTVAKDPYGSPFAYRAFDDGAGYLIASLGDDGQFGGDGDAADTVYLWDFATQGHADLFTYGGWTRPER